LVRTKKLREVILQLSPESSNVRSPLPDSVRTPLDLVKSGRIQAIWAKSGRISGQIHLNPAGLVAGSCQIRPDSGQFQPESDPLAFGDGGRMLQDSGGRMLPDSSAAWILTTEHYQILAIGYQMCVQRRRV
jgi:hypothetical protein